MKTFIFLLFILAIFVLIIKFCRRYYSEITQSKVSDEVLLDYLKQRLALSDHRSYWYTDLPWAYEVKEVSKFLQGHQLGDLPERAINEYLSDIKSEYPFFQIRSNP